MAKKIDDDMIEYVSILAKLELDGEERQRAKEDMEKMLVFADKLNDLDTDKTKPLVQAVMLENVFRDDEVTNENDRDAMLKNAPEKKDGQYVVPQTFS